jgi:hypothetical protein
MGAGYDLLGIEAVLDRPLSPDARDGWSGIDEDSVHIEEDGCAVNLGHPEGIPRRFNSSIEGMMVSSSMLQSIVVETGMARPMAMGTARRDPDASFGGTASGSGGRRRLPVPRFGPSGICRCCVAGGVI